MTSESGQTGRPVAIVTGSARRIGAAIVGHLHDRGLDVLIHYRHSASEAESLAGRLNRERAGSAATVGADLAGRDAPGRIAAAALERFGRIDVLVNNASAFFPSPVEQADQAQFDTLIDANLRAPFFLSQACMPSLRVNRGAIVNIVDIHAMVPMPRHALYSQAKAGLQMQTRALARELAPEIRVNGVAPGAILWPENDQSPEAAEAIVDRIPMGRPGQPEDIAGAVAYLALDAPYITGQILTVDGGRLLNM